MQFKKDDLIFLPLGGSNEIGMNVNLYHYKGKWLMIDLGAGFADEHYPGISMLAPDLSFIDTIRENFLGVVLTHAHEDHLGSTGWLWHKLQAPIYATPFAAAVVKNKLQQVPNGGQAVINIVKPGSKFSVGPFELEMVQLTHSIPEMNALAIRTEYGHIMHTGDWKFDPNPVVGQVSDIATLERLGSEGVLAMVCDSTNVFNDRQTGSEGDLRESLIELFSDRKGMVVVTTFASNVARMQTIAEAAKAVGRKVALAGLSLHRISSIARDTGYMLDIDPFISEKELKNYPRDRVLLMCTGCQGEPNAAMSKIASGKHPEIRLHPQDTVVFSSKIIPGNEKKIFRLFNAFVRMGLDVFTEKDHFVHVSGHPSSAELTQMYNYVKPKIAIPVHGEPLHLHEHVKLAKRVGVPSTVEIQNGQMVRLAPGEPQALAQVTSGYLAVDGALLHPRDGEVMKTRRRLQAEGVVFVSLVVNQNGALAVEPVISTHGVLDDKEYRKFIYQMMEELIQIIDAQRDGSNENLIKVTRHTVRRLLRAVAGKEPSIEVHLSRV